MYTFLKFSNRRVENLFLFYIYKLKIKRLVIKSCKENSKMIVLQKTTVSTATSQRKWRG